MKNCIVFKIKTIYVLLVLLFLPYYGCNNATMMSNIYDSNCTCDDKTIIKVLEGEPAYVRKHCFQHVGRVDTFYFDLVSQHSEFFSLSGLFPCSEIPEQFRKEGLSVIINGNVTSCLVGFGCIEPNIKLPHIHLFELKSIKLNNK